jgi:hypothetical protein
VVNVALQKATVLDAQHVLLMTASVQLVVQIIILVTINVSPVEQVIRHHRALHLLHRAPLVVPVGKHTSPTIPTVAVIQALDIRV